MEARCVGCDIDAFNHIFIGFLFEFVLHVLVYVVGLVVCFLVCPEVF